MRGTPLPFYHSMNKQTFIMGVNNEVFNLLLTISVAVAFSGRFINVFADILAVLIFVIGVALGKKLTKVDPQIMEVYRRHIHYRKYYAPTAGIHADSKIIKPSVPFYVGK